MSNNLLPLEFRALPYSKIFGLKQGMIMFAISEHKHTNRNSNIDLLIILFLHNVSWFPPYYPLSSTPILWFCFSCYFWKWRNVVMGALVLIMCISWFYHFTKVFLFLKLNNTVKFVKHHIAFV